MSETGVCVLLNMWPRTLGDAVAKGNMDPLFLLYSFSDTVGVG